MKQNYNKNHLFPTNNLKNRKKWGGERRAQKFTTDHPGFETQN